MFAAGIDIGHLPYKSGGEPSTALLGRQVDFAAFNFSPPTWSLLKSGQLRALAGCTDKRVDAFPDVPTLKEEGYPHAFVTFWYGYFLLAGTPQPIVDKLASAFEKTINNPKLINKLLETVNITDYIAGSAFTEYLIKERQVIEDVARRAKMIK